MYKVKQYLDGARAQKFIPACRKIATSFESTRKHAYVDKSKKIFYDLKVCPE